MIDEQEALAAWELAPRCCRPDHGCCNYHRIWPFLRYLLPPKAVFGAEEITREVVALANADARILICGAADSAVLDIVLGACRSLPNPPAVDIIERCETACKVLRLYKDRHQASFNIINGDFVESSALYKDANSPYQMIVAHNILGQIPGDLRSTVCTNWGLMASEGARLMLVQTLYPNDDAWLQPNAERNIQTAIDSVAEGLRNHDISAAMSKEVLEVAEQFWQGSHRQAPALTHRSVIALLAGAGFDCEQVDKDNEDQRGPASAGVVRADDRSRCLFSAVRCSYQVNL